jgi:Na+/melibiose symporter-like transporter
MLLSSDIRCTEFVTLKVKGSCNSCWSLSDNSFASLYAGACCQFTTGRMGATGLWIFSRPRMLGGCGFILVYFYLEWCGISVLHALMVFLVSRVNKVVGSLEIFTNSLLRRKSWTLESYASFVVMMRVWPLSALVIMLLFCSSFSRIPFSILCSL